MKFYLIGDEDAVLGFSMVGVYGRVATNREEALAALTEILEKHEIGILIITEGVVARIREEVDHLLFSKDLPLVVEIPDRKTTRPSSLRQMIQKAIGIPV